MFELVDQNWKRVLDDAIDADASSIRVICPFVKRGAVEHLLRRQRKKPFQLITRFCLTDFFHGVSDPGALELLLAHGARIRGIRNLHSKVYLFGQTRAIVTSANLTTAALSRNHEFGFVTDEVSIVSRCGRYFDDLWKRAGTDLSLIQPREWIRQVNTCLARANPSADPFELTDNGVDAKLPKERIVRARWAGDATQTFVKFFGEGHTRADRQQSILDEVQRSGSHAAGSYPKGKRPRQVKDGATMFMARLVKDPNDILIYGRATAVSYMQSRDDAGKADIARRSWKAKYPHQIRVYHPEFIAGKLSNGVSLNQLMDRFKDQAFASTQRNAARAKGNKDPRHAYRQQPAVELSREGAAWMNEQFERALSDKGRLSAGDLARID